VRRYLGGLPSTGREETWRDVGIRPPTGVVRKTVYHGMEPRARTQIVFTGSFDFNRENLYALRALEDVLRLRLRERLREDLGGTYGVRVRASGGRDPRAEYRVAVGFGAAPARLEELARVAFAQIDSLKDDGPTEEELAKVREMQLRSRETDLRTNHFWLSQLVAYNRHRHGSSSGKACINISASDRYGLRALRTGQIFRALRSRARGASAEALI
jgi:zinc protease